MARLKALLERKKELAAQVRQFADKVNAENRDFSADEKAGWDKVNADYDANERAIAIEQRAEEVGRIDAAHDRRPPAFMGERRQIGSDGAATVGAIDDNVRAMAISGWFASQSDVEPSDAQIDAMERVGLMNQRGRIRGELCLGLSSTSQLASMQRQYAAANRMEREAMLRGDRIGAAGLDTSTGGSPYSGYVIAPGSLIRSLEVNMLAFGGVRQVAETIRSTNGEPLYWPTADDTSNTGELLAEKGSIGSTTDPSFGRQQWLAYKFSSKLVKFTAELLQDSAFDIPSVLGTMLGERLGRITNTYYTTGTGSSQPAGIVTGAGAGVTAASTTAITADEIIDLIHSVDPAYRTAGCGFMMHDNTVKLLRKLKDSNGQYLWQSGSPSAGAFGAGFADSLRGYPVTVNQDMDSSLAATDVAILFGRLSNYKIRSVAEIRIRRLQELYAATDEEGMIAFIREDAKLLNPGTNSVKKLAMDA